MQYSIDASAIKKYSGTLLKLRKSAFPAAVFTTLNKAVKHVKVETMPASASVFTKRSPNFFKANSKYTSASGYNVNEMKARVGFISDQLAGRNNYAVKDLEQQELGGTIKKRSFIASDGARIGNNGLVRANARLSAIRGIIDARKMPGVTDKVKFYNAVLRAGKGGLVLSNYKSHTFLWKVNSLKKTDAGQFKLTKLYTFKENRAVHVQATHFMKIASLKSASNLNKWFYEAAEKQITKLPNANKGGHH